MFLYNLSIHFYFYFIWLVSPFIPKAKLFIEGRKKIWDKLNKIDNSNIIWFHCASLGEFDQGIPVMSILKEKDPSVKILVTFFSPSGMEHYNKRKHVADYVFYLPIDSKRNAKKFVNIIQPKKIFFVKYEFWLNYIFTAKSHNIPLYSISCILRPDQHFFKPIGKHFRKGLQCFNTFFVQNDETKRLLESINIKDVVITGDTRYDKVIDNRLNLREDTILHEFLKEEKAIILGSSWQEEEEILSNFLETFKIHDKIIIAPHDISEKHLKKIENLFPSKTIRFSNFDHYDNQQIIIIDCIGKLANAYYYGKLAFVGGGFSGSLHNTLEPIVFGVPTVFGPKHSKFPEADFFIQENVALNVTNDMELHNAYEHFSKNYLETKNKCEELINLSKGASQKIIERVYQ